MATIHVDGRTYEVDPSRNLLQACLEAGQGRAGDLEKLLHHCHFLGMGFTFCALAPGAVEPLQSALKYFRADFERHLREGRCPYGNGTQAPGHSGTRERLAPAA